MKTCFALLAAFVTLLGSSGCVGYGGTEQRSLPGDWLAAVPKPGAPGADLTGVFVELGEQLDARYTRDGTIGPGNLSSFLSSKTMRSTAVRRPPDRGGTVELRRTDATHLELITRAEGATDRRITFEFEFEKDTGTMVLHRGEPLKSGGEFLAVGYDSLAIRLWRGPDGRLYAHGTRRGVGLVLLMPVMVSTEVWCRWDAATPTALQKQSATLAKQAEAGARAAELNRNRATVGTKAPAFAATDLLTGRAVTSADYAGKVVLLHVWATGTGSRMLKPLHAAYATGRARGLEIVGLCINRENEREKVVDFIKSNDLTWPQLYDGRGTDGTVFQAYYGTIAAPLYCVIDRHGNVAASVRTASELEAAVAGTLAAP